MSDADCDAIVIGSGPGGAVAADVLTAAGWSVIMLEKGRNHLVDLEAPFGQLPHAANDELAYVHRHLLGPDPMLEPRTYRRNRDDGERLLTGEVNNLPSTLGGGGFHADAKLPRFREEDFALTSSRGPINDDRVDVADWPITYADLEPHYAEVERILGVAGEAGTNPFAAWRSTDFPMSPGADMAHALVTSAAAERAGFHPYRAPTGINSVPYDARDACVDCGFCGNYGCPVGAKGDPIASLQRMLRTGRGQIRPEAYVTDILLDRTGRRARGVRYLDLTGYPEPRRVELRAARAVVLAGGAFETPRLLLRNGIGGDAVGRHLTFHFQTFSVGIFPDSVGGDRGRDVTHLHDDLMIDTPTLRRVAKDAGLAWVRGGVTEHSSASHPITEALTQPRGEFHWPAMINGALRRRMWVLTVQGEDLPQPTNRIDLDPDVRDAWGYPAGRVTYAPHRHELVASAHAGRVHEALLVDAGAEAAFSSTSPPIDELALHADVNPIGIAPASRHIMGTARMGSDPSSSVVDPHQRVWDVENLVICDSSVFVTSSGYNPTLTLAALSHRAASLLVS